MMSISNFREGNEGSSAVVWSDKLQKWYCGDSEGNVFAKSDDQDEHETTSLISDPIRSIAFHPTKDECAVAEDDTVSIRSATNLESIIDQGVCKSNLPFTRIEYDHQGRFIFAASMEADVSVVSVGKNTTQKISTGGVGVRTFSLSPDSKHIAIVDIDGGVSVSALGFSRSVDGTSSLGQQDMVSYITGLVTKTATRNANDAGCKLAWYPSAEKVLLAVPSLNGSVVILVPAQKNNEERKWDESFLIATGHAFNHGDNDLCMAEFSPNGRYLATADLAGTVLVWAFNAKNPAKSEPLYKLNSEPLLSLRDIVWGRRAQDNYLIATTANDWHQFPEVVRGGKPLPALLDGAALPASAATTGAAGVSFTQAPTQVASQLDDLNASDYLARTQAEDEAAMLAAVEAAEAQYARTQEAHAALEKTVSPKKAAKVAAAATSTLKRLTKKSNASAVDDEDDTLFDDDVVAVSAPASSSSAATTSAATAEAASKPEEEGTINLAAIKAKAAPTASKHLLDDEAEDDDDVDDYDNDDADMIVDDAAPGQMSLQQMLKIAQQGTATAAPERVLQAPFQPASTKFDEKRRRYLVWNNVGSILLREESVENRVEINFANTAGSNRNEAFADRDGFTMGALSYEGAVFACPPEPAEEPVGTDRDPEFRKETPGSTIVYHAFAGQKHMMGANESFRWTLSDSEAALAVAVGRGWVAVASSRNLLYVFTSAGMPCATMALAGPVVSLSGSEMQLGVVYHSHTLQADLFEINWQAGCSVRKITSVPLPLPAKVDDKPQVGIVNLLSAAVRKEQALEWLGFDVDNRLLTILDAQGSVWCLVQCAGWQWVPVLDTHKVRKSTEHTYWPVMVKFGKLVYVLLNGESRPAVYPQPVVATRQLRVPVPCLRDGKDVGDTHKERMHSILWGGALTTHTEAQLAEASAASGAGKVAAEDPEVLEKRLETLQFETDKAVLKALQDACQRQRIPLALSLALQLRTEHVIETAITVANHFGRALVAEALDTILDHKRALAAALLAHQQGPAYHDGPAYSSSEYAHEEDNHYQDAPSFDDESSPVPNRNVTFAEETNTLSNKLSRTMPPPSSKLSAAQVVSPTLTGSAEKEKAPARNPFAVVSSGTTPQKRKNVFDGIQDMKASPSPKKPALNRQGSFSQQARQQRLSDKRIL